MSWKRAAYRGLFGAWFVTRSATIGTVNIRLPATFVAALACAAAAPAWSQQAGSNILPAATVAQAVALAADAARAIAPPRARIEVTPGALDARLQLAPCARIEPYLPAGVPAWGVTRVGVRCTDGRARWSVYLPLTVHVWAAAVVSMANLPAGARLTASGLGHAEVDWSATTSPAYADAAELAGRVLARPLGAGQPVRAADLQVRMWFAQGDNVRIVVAGSGFSITGEGQALSPGYEDRPTRVRTENGRVLEGRAVGERQVEVGL
ncbi:MAG: flagellar basal body P-ring formation protein FlgA [Burkholderiales bacterium]|nr:flagellar basal body P-ring formation protein FlgA [Burkholderiales bacterium]